LPCAPDKPVDLGFVNSRDGDFNLKNGALLRLRIPSFEPIPSAKIGLFKNKWRQTLPPRP
jgi:hypothetical protein